MSGDGCVLIGYHSVEARFALRLATDLKSEGIHVKMDRLDLLPGDYYELTQETMLRQSLALVALLSPDYVSSSYGRHELSYAQEASLPVIPVLLRPVSPVDWLAEATLLHGDVIDLSDWYAPGHYAAALAQISARLRSLPRITASRLVNPERRYINQLLAGVEIHKTALEYVRLSYQAAQAETLLIRPAPRLEPNYGLSGPFILRDAPLAQARYLANLPAALEQFPRLVLAGESGSGKTTTLHRLVEDAARTYRQEPRGTALPLLAHLAHWSPEVSLTDFLKAQWPLKADVLDWLARGWVTLYLDGLDEMPAGTTQIDALRDWLHGPTAPQRVVIACRLSAYDDRTALDLPVVCIEEMTDSQVREMVTLHLGEAAGHTFFQQFAGSEDTLLRNRLLLRLLLYLALSSPAADLPRTPAAILYRFVEVVWERERLLQSPDWVPLEELLDWLAALVHTTLVAGHAFTLPLAAVPPEQHSRLYALCSAGLMQHQGDRVTFVHPLLAHLLVALQLRHDNWHEHLQYPAFSTTGRRMAARLDEAVCLLAGLLPDAEPLIQTLTDIDPYLAAECLAAGAVVSAAVRQQVVARLVYFAMAQENAGQAAAADALQRLGHGDALPLLLEQMRHAPWPARMQAADFLRLQGITADADLLEVFNLWHFITADADLLEVFNLWHFDMDETVAVALRQAGEEALPVILRLLEHDDAARRRGAAWAAGEMSDAAAVPALVAALGDAEIAVRREAISALRRIQDAAMVPHLLPL
nr:HEAT repeat domain-containing protein [Anaerolineae bacterium]